MTIINVITLYNGLLRDIVSFPINNKEEEKVQVRKAEDAFCKLMNEFGFKANEANMEAAVEDGYWENYNGHEVMISWSKVII